MPWQREFPYNNLVWIANQITYMCVLVKCTVWVCMCMCDMYVGETADRHNYLMIICVIWEAVWCSMQSWTSPTVHVMWRPEREKDRNREGQEWTCNQTTEYWYRYHDPRCRKVYSQYMLTHAYIHIVPGMIMTDCVVRIIKYCFLTWMWNVVTTYKHSNEIHICE